MKIETKADAEKIAQELAQSTTDSAQKAMGSAAKTAEEPFGTGKESTGPVKVDDKENISRSDDMPPATKGKTGGIGKKISEGVSDLVNKIKGSIV